MKKILMSVLVICTMLFMTSPSLACDCGCNKTGVDTEIGCAKDCNCGCQKGEECKCKSTKKECCKKCTCGCPKGEECKCKKECDNPKCAKEKSLFEQIKDSTTEEISQFPKSECGCKRGEVRTKCKKSKWFKKCKKAKKGCPLKEITE